MAAYGIQQAVWQDSDINTLEINRVVESYCPAASASLPLPRQAAGTLGAIWRVFSVNGSLNSLLFNRAEFCPQAFANEIC